MNAGVGRRNTGRRPGLQMAAIVYLAIVAIGLGGAAANALWILNGKIVTTVTAGSWAPKTVDAAAVKCAREDETLSGQEYSNLILNWEDIGANSYAVSVVGKQENVAMETTTLKSPVTFRLPRNNFTGNRTYTVTITPRRVPASMEGRQSLKPK